VPNTNNHLKIPKKVMVVKYRYKIIEKQYQLEIVLIKKLVIKFLNLLILQNLTNIIILDMVEYKKNHHKEIFILFKIKNNKIIKKIIIEILVEIIPN
jgi:hypothetical protein